MNKARRRSGTCLNCGTTLGPAINFCPECGQENHRRKVPVRQVVKDFVDDYFTFDSRLFRSILPLLLKPGFLTMEFNAGRRARYIPPLRMYLFISVLFFFVLSLEDNPLVPQDDIEDGLNTRVSIAAGDRKIVRSGTQELRKDIAAAGGVEAFMRDSLPDDGSIEAYFARNMLEAIEAGQSSIDRLYSALSIMMFFLMPVLALLLKMVYFRKKMYFVEHMVFSFHVHSFYFLLLILYYLVAKFIYGMQEQPFVLLGALVYIFIALKRVYQATWWRTVGNFIVLGLLYSVCIIIFSVATVLISVLTQ